MNPPAATAFTDAAATWNRRFDADDWLFGTDPNAWLTAHAGVGAPGTPAMLREAFAEIEIALLRDHEADIAEGSGHRGRSALIGLAARRGR